MHSKESSIDPKTKPSTQYKDFLVFTAILLVLQLVYCGFLITS